MAATIMSYKVAVFGLSHIGRVRQNNEDVFAILPDCDFFVLADGMGGHQAGEVAAKEAVRLVCDFAKKTWGNPAVKCSFHDMRRLMRQAIEEVNSTVFKMSRTNPQLKGMGTTLCCMHFHAKGVVYAHVGDSRIYRWRRRRLEQITKDHSLFRELVDQGQLTEHQPDFLYRNIITKAIGTESFVDPSVHLSDIEVDDLYLMCTDGLSDLLTTREIQGVINQGGSLEEIGQELIATANARGGYDNVTVLIMKVILENEKKTDLPR
jgi:protein phosphatase